MKWFIKVLSQYADFSGRARRKEYWMFVLFYMIFGFVAIIIDSVIMVLLELKQPILACTGVYYVAMILPTLALTVRRLHDTGRNGWWIFITMIPLVGGIWFLVLLVEESQYDNNRYGTNPKISPQKPDEKARLTSVAVTMIVASIVMLLYVIAIRIYNGIPLYFDIFFIANLVLSLLMLLAGILLLQRPAYGSRIEYARRMVFIPLIIYALICIVRNVWNIWIITNIETIIYLGTFILNSIALMFFAVTLVTSNKNLLKTAAIILIVMSGIVISYSIYICINWIFILPETICTSLTYISLILLASVFIPRKSDDNDEVHDSSASVFIPRKSDEVHVLPASGDDYSGFRMPASAVHPNWFFSKDVHANMIRPIKATWYVDCRIFTISDSDSAAIESKYPRNTAPGIIGGEGIPYAIEMSANAIFTHEYGAFLDYGYVKFLYRDRIYYVNVSPMVQLTHDLYNRHDLLCHLAKILIVLLPAINDRKNILIALDGELKQDVNN
jgi:uncharacterized membrane protein YhaH (DUF805 family)